MLIPSSWGNSLMSLARFRWPSLWWEIPKNESQILLALQHERSVHLRIRRRYGRAIRHKIKNLGDSAQYGKSSARSFKLCSKWISLYILWLGWWLGATQLIREAHECRQKCQLDVIRDYRDQWDCTGPMVHSCDPHQWLGNRDSGRYGCYWWRYFLPWRCLHLWYKDGLIWPENWKFQRNLAVLMHRQ